MLGIATKRGGSTLLKLSIDQERLMTQIREIENKITDSDPFLLQELDLLKERVNKSVFKIVIVGHFSAGKSTFLNALIGRKLLPSSASETTAASTRVYSVSELSPLANKAEVLFRNGNKQLLDLSEGEGDIEFYVSLLKGGFDIARDIEYVDVYLINSKQPTAICLVDTPGANGLAKEIFETTKKEIKDAAAIVYLLPNRGFSDPDRQLLDYISNYQDRLFFVLNQLDLIAEEERSEMLEHVKKQAKELVGVENPTIYGISSRYALEGRKQHNESLAQKWGFSELEYALTTYMNNTEFVQGFYDSIQRQIHYLEQELESSLAKQQDELEHKQHRAKRHIQFVRRRFLALEKNLVSFIDEQTMSLQKNIENNASSWIEPAVNSSSSYLSNEIKLLNKRLKQLPADRIIESVQQEFKALDHVIQRQVSDIIQQFQKKTRGFLDTITDKFQQRNQEVFDLILQFEREGEDELTHLAQLKENIQAKAFTFQSLSTKAFSNDIHLFETVTEKQRSMEAKTQTIKQRLKQTVDEINETRKTEEREFQRHKEAIQRLGSMPDVDRWEEEYQVKRSGFLGWLRMSKTKTKICSDDSKQKSWLKQKEDLEQRFYNVQSSLQQRDQELSQLKLQLSRSERDNSCQLMALEMEMEQILDDLLDKVLNTSLAFTRQLEIELRAYLHDYVVSIYSGCYEDIMKDRDEIVKWIRDAIRAQQKETEDELMGAVNLN